MIGPGFGHRSNEPEIIDDFTLGGEEIAATLRSIESVNSWLGGNRVLVDGLKEILSHPSFARLGRPIVVHDFGCGSGDGLRALAEWGRENDRPLRLVGLDANPHVVEYARAQAPELSEIEFRHRDILETDLPGAGVDVVTFNLCLHHFTDTQILEFLRKCRAAGVRAVLINDLHRHWLAYYLFYLVCFVFRSPRIARVDGLLSVRKGFRRNELATLASKAGADSSTLQWRWAFRYQCLLFFS